MGGFAPIASTASKNGAGFITMPGAAAVGRVVHGAVLVVRVVAQVDELVRARAPPPRRARGNREAERPLEELRKDRDDADGQHRAHSAAGEESVGNRDGERAARAIDAAHELFVERERDVTARRAHVEQHALRHRVPRAHVAEFGAAFIEHAHAAELVEEDLAVPGLGEFVERHEQVAPVPALGLRAVADGVERDEQTTLERAARGDLHRASRAAHGIVPGLAGGRPLKDARAGREDQRPASR